MKWFLRVLMGGLIFFVFMWATNFAFDLINRPSNIAVIFGLLIITVLVGVASVMVAKIYPRIKARLQGSPPGISGMVTVVGFLGLMIGSSFLTACGCAVVEPGHVGIVVNRLGDDRGVSDFTLETGFVIYNPLAKQVFEYPTFVQTAVWTKDSVDASPENEEVTFNTKEGLLVTGDISLSYQLDRDKVPAFYVKFRSDNLWTFTHGFLRNVARDQFNEIAGRYSVEEIYGEGKEKFTQEVRARINQQVANYGVQIEQFGFIGAPRPPDSVIEQLNAKVAAVQRAMRAENELREAQAEARKRQAIAEGEARANEVLARSLSNPLIEWRRLIILEQAVNKWNGQRPMVEGDGGGLLLQIPLQNGNQPVSRE